MTKNLQKIITFIILSLLLAYIYDFTEIDHERIEKLHQQSDSVFQTKQQRLTTLPTSKLETPVSLRNAGKEELLTLKGIGPKMAERIIQYRNKNGFSKIEDLMKVKGIGSKKFEQIKSRLVL